MLDELVNQFQAGGADVEAFLAAHPEHAEELRRLLPAVQMMANLSGHALVEGGSPLGELGDFRLIREVGRGGMGVVYEAEQVSLNRRVALKVLPLAATMDPRQLQRFRREAQAAALLHHPHVVPVYAVGCEKGVHYYAMQLIDGRSLADVIRGLRGDPPPPPAGDTRDHRPGAASPTAPAAALPTARDRDYYRTAARQIAQAAEALEYAHSLGVVHRDVKPANLLLDASGHLWVTDFGLARFGADAGLTVSGDLLGTLRYMSPEQALAKHGLVDHRSDVYSLGATLYELLTLRPAVDGEDKQEILRNIAFAEPARPRKQDKSIPAELETVALKCLAKNPAERYATAGELADDLRRWLADRTIRAKPPTLRQRAAKWSRRHRPVVASAVVLLLVGAVALAVSTVLVLRANGRTEARFRAARDAVDDMYTQVAEEWLDDAPRLTDVQKTFLDKALHFYQQFGAEHADDPAVRHEAARAYLRVGRIQAKSGRYAEAEVAHREAIARSEALAAAFPGDPKFREGLAAGYHSLGSLLRENVRSQEAEQPLLRAIDLRRQLVAEAPELPGSWPDLARSQTMLAVLYSDTGRHPDAERAYGQALEIWERLAAAYPKDPSYQSLLGMALNNLVQLRIGSDPNRIGGDPAEAERLLTRAIGHQQAARKGNPRRVEYRARLRIHHMGRGDLLMRLGRSAEAEKDYGEATRLAQQLLDDFPGVPEHREVMAKLCINRSAYLGQAGRRSEAIGFQRTARDLTRGLVEEFPDAPNYQHLLVQALTELALAVGELQAGQGATGRDAGQLREAELAYREAAGVLERLADRFPEEPEHRHKLGGTLHNLARLFNQRGDEPTEARALIQRAIGLQRQALQARPQHPKYRQYLRNHYAILASDRDRVAEQHFRAGRIEEGEKVYRQIQDQYEKLTAEFQDQPAYQDDLAMALGHWAVQYVRLGRRDLFARSRPLLEQAIDHEQAAIQARPREAHYRANLIGYHRALADSSLRLRDWKAAEAAYRRASDLAQRLTEEFSGVPDYRWVLSSIQVPLGHLLMDPTVWREPRLAEAEPVLRAAVASWEQLLKDQPEAPGHRSGLANAVDQHGFCLLLAGRVPEAEQAMRRALELTEQEYAKRPAPPRNRSELGAKAHNLAQVLYGRGALAEACELLAKAVEHQQAAVKAEPENPTYRQFMANHSWLLGMVLWRQGRPAEARDAFQNAVRLKPEEAEHYEGLAWLLANDPNPLLRDPPRAIELAKKATELGGGRETAWQALGMASYRAGRWQEAVAALERARSLGAEGTDSFFLAMARWQLGEKEPARKLYAEGVQWMETNKPRDDGKDRFDRLPVGEMHRFREEARTLLGIRDDAAKDGSPVPPKD
jgi:serine/threonine protein kinase/Flp pilus assembly protein TadD